MLLNVLSDLHLSVCPLDAPASGADVAILAGDLGRPAQAIAWALQLGKRVLFVPGNHEFYGGSIDGTVEQLKRLARGTPVTVLDDEAVVLDGVRFLGSTLWTDFLLFGDGAPRAAAEQEALQRMHDFSRIFADRAKQVPFTPGDAAARFRRHAHWLQQKLQEPHAGPTVVITHHAPSPRSIEARFEGSLLNACFASRADHLLEGGRAALWIHGHMHHSVDYVLHGTRVVSNPRGYAPGGRLENPQFDAGFTVAVG